MSLWSWFSAPPKTGDNGSSGGQGGCPVDHKTREEYMNANQRNTNDTSSSGQKLSTEREISSIPRFISAGVTPESSSNGGESSNSACPVNHQSSKKENEGEGKWIYPSPRQFYDALVRKNRDARAQDMDVVVPIHNAVNERCWGEILEWERAVNDKNEDVKLESFRGRPNDRSPRAWMKVLSGYTAPFDRHDWTIVRNDGTRIRYVIDFYTGKGSTSKLSFHVDVRPAVDGMEGMRMRMGRALGMYV